ncbi:Membrane-bound O-acyltransferase family protein OS=Lysinibacillus sphaericus OX=1421 GN=LS41612_19795 PE=3 SV=1 [Lysinibacillus sphaericus]
MHFHLSKRCLGFPMPHCTIMKPILLTKDYALYFVIAIIFAMPIYKLYQTWSEQKAAASLSFDWGLRITQTVYYGALLLFITMFLVNATHNPFIYFRF